MAKKTSTRLSQTAAQALAQVQTPVSMDEIADRVVKRYPSRAKNPLASIRNHLRTDHVGKTLVLLDRKTVVPIQVVMRVMWWPARRANRRPHRLRVATVRASWRKLAVAVHNMARRLSSTGEAQLS